MRPALPPRLFESSRLFWFRPALLLMLLTSTLSFLSTHVCADQALAKRLERLKADINGAEAKLKKQLAERSVNARNIRENNQQLARIERESLRIRDLLDDKSEELARLTGAQEKLRAQQQSLLDLAASLMVERYLLAERYLQTEAGSAKRAVSLALASKKLSDLETQIVYQAHLNKGQEQVITKQSKQLTRLAESQRQLNEKRKALQNEQEKQKDLSKRLLAINQQRKARETALAGELAASNNQLQELQSARRALEDALQASQRGLRHRGKAATQDSFSLSIKAKKIRSFGQSRVGQRMRWQGNVYALPQKSQVRALAEGTVIFAEYLKGYGELVIIDHGNALLSLYAYNARPLVKVGERIKKQQVIALSGFAETVGQPALYLEIRKQGQAVNPASWL